MSSEEAPDFDFMVFVNLGLTVNAQITTGSSKADARARSHEPKDQ